jgi:N-acetylmuramoyl-L-alanine amidase
MDATSSVGIPEGRACEPGDHPASLHMHDRSSGAQSERGLRRWVAPAGLLLLCLCNDTTWAAPAGQCDPKTFRMILDVGHTDEKAGATSARGAREYDFNLALAKTIDQALKRVGFEREVLLITKDWKHSGLFGRARRANAMPADLFLSIHHDSVPDPLLERWEYEGESLFYNDRFPGHSLFVSIHNGNYAGSLAFAHLLGNQLKAHGLKYTPHYTERFMKSRQRILVDKEAGVYRYDQLIVLKETKVPAVLLEAGSIINRDEELLLQTDEHRAKFSASVVDAVKAFCEMRATRTATTATVPTSKSAPKDASATAPKTATKPTFAPASVPASATARP